MPPRIISARPEARADAHEFFGNVLRLSRKNVLRQPLLQIEIVGEAAEQRHRHVRVAVDQTGNYDFAGALMTSRSRVIAIDFGASSRPQRCARPLRRRRRFRSRARSVHRDDRAARCRLSPQQFSCAEQILTLTSR